MQVSKVNEKQSFQKLLASPEAQKTRAFKKLKRELIMDGELYDIWISLKKKNFFTKKFHIKVQNIPDKILGNKIVVSEAETKNLNTLNLQRKILETTNYVREEKNRIFKEIYKNNPFVKSAYDQISELLKKYGNMKI